MRIIIEVLSNRENGLINGHIYLNMPLKEKRTKKEIVEERLPKHVNIRVSYRDYLKLVEVANAAASMKDNKELKKVFSKVISEVDEDLNADKFLGLVAGLPAKERTLERFFSQPPRSGPVRMYFTDPEKCATTVHELYEASKKWTKGKLRYDQSKETCPTDVRVMFYAYIRGKGLVEDGNPEITIDKFLKKVAPKTLSGVKHVKRNNGSLVWEICSEIRGKPRTKKSGGEEPKKTKKKPIVESSDEESDEEPPKRKGKKIVEVSESESDEESSEEEEVPKKNKPKRR